LIRGGKGQKNPELIAVAKAPKKKPNPSFRLQSTRA